MAPHRERNESEIKTDVTIYGATSFVARHVLNYLVDVGPTLPRKIKVTLAGRSESKLQTVLSKFTPLVDTKGQFVALDVVVADSADHDALNKMATRTRVVINCAGPFELYSSPVVKACAETGCDYVDITGEVGWVGDMRVQYGPAASKSGARMISLCGFDSIPSDMAIFAAVQALRSSCAQVEDSSSLQQPQQSPLEITTARTWHVVFGQAGGGTLATMKNMKVNILKCLFENNYSLRKVPLLLWDPLVLTNPEAVRFNPDYKDTRDRMALSEWINCLPFPHTIFKQGVSIPFFMAVANAKVVQASAVALNYGPQFTYKERYLPLGFDLTIGFGLFSTIPSLVILWFIAMCGLIIKLPIVGDVLLNMMAPPGTGASDEACRKGFAKVYAEVKAPLTTTTNNTDDKNTQSATTTTTTREVESEGPVACANCYMEFQGDPGNWITAQCVVEAALSLLLNRKELPTRSKDGFGTPAELLGPVLLMRLKDTKVRPVTVKTHVRRNEREHEYKVYM